MLGGPVNISMDVDGTNSHTTIKVYGTNDALACLLNFIYPVLKEILL